MLRALATRRTQHTWTHLVGQFGPQLASHGQQHCQLSLLSTDACALVPGAAFSLTRQFSEAEVAAFVQMTGDHNPIHTQSAAAAAAGLPGCILPGMLSASLFPAIIGTSFPGAVYLSQTLKFKHYALVGDALIATVTVEKASGSRVSFGTKCQRAGSGEVVVEGTALALIRRQGG